MNNKPIISISSQSATVILGGKPYVIRAGQPQWPEFQAAYKAKNWNLVRKLVSVVNAIALYTEGKVKIIEGAVLFDGKPAPEYIGNKIFQFFKENKPFEPLVKFLNKVMANPVESARNELFEFLEKGNIPITDEGDFLAYRKVDQNYLSYHQNPDGTRSRNMVGDIVEDKEENVDRNRNNTCSTGRHFCAFGYLDKYHGGNGKVMMVKIEPQNVRAFPGDHNTSKGRCVKYEVVAEVSEQAEPSSDVLAEDPLFVKVQESGKTVYKPSKAVRRDRNGRFAGKPKRDKKRPFLS